MAQVPILNGIYGAGTVPELRVAYPRNLEPVIQPSGLSDGYLKPAAGVRQVATGPGQGRGGTVWNGAVYRVSGTKLIRVNADDSVSVLGDVLGLPDEPVSFTNSFDRLAVASGKHLYFFDGTNIKPNADPDLGKVLDVVFIGGYFMATDGENIVVTELNNPFSVLPTKYGSSEAKPDPIMAVDELKSEAIAFNRYTIEFFANVGGDGFPFQVIKGAQLTKGIIGTHAYTSLGDTFAFVGSGFNEAPGVYMLVPGDTPKISTQEVDRVLASYSEQALADGCVLECRADRNKQVVLVHLPDQCWCFDLIGTKLAGEPIWYRLDTGMLSASRYRARGLVWCYGRWNVDDPTSNALGVLDDTVASHYGVEIGWEFNVPVVYNDGDDAVVHELELVSLAGRCALGAEPAIWSSYSYDGVTFSQERAKAAGIRGDFRKRIAWRTQGTLSHWRVQRFRGTSEAMVSPARLECRFEALHTRPGP